MRKALEIQFHDSCLNKASLDEPLFVLRGKDRLAPAVVRFWAELAEKEKAHEDYKIAEANLCAGEMETWRAEHMKAKS